jgi:hypothetical protein
VILNGIDQLAERADLADRALVLTLPRIDEADRKDEAELYTEFERSLPKILGALFTAVSSALARIEQTELARKPRMADFALWATAAEPGFGFEDGVFMEAYAGNRAEAVQDTLESDPVAACLDSFMEERDEQWDGSCKDLLDHLKLIAGDATAKTRAWPQSARALSGRLRRLATFLRESGIEIAFRRTGGQRMVLISKNGRAFDRH